MPCARRVRRSGEHWDGLPDGSGRATTYRVTDLDQTPPSPRSQPAHPLEALLTRSAASQVVVERRSLAAYDHAAGLSGHPAGKGRAGS